MSRLGKCRKVSESVGKSWKFPKGLFGPVRTFIEFFAYRCNFYCSCMWVTNSRFSARWVLLFRSERCINGSPMSGWIWPGLSQKASHTFVSYLSFFSSSAPWSMCVELPFSHLPLTARYHCWSDEAHLRRTSSYLFPVLNYCIFHKTVRKPPNGLASFSVILMCAVYT